MANDLTLRLLSALEKTILENAILRAYLSQNHPNSQWEMHLSTMMSDSSVQAIIRERFAELRLQAQAAHSESEVLLQLLEAFPPKKDWN